MPSERLTLVTPRDLDLFHALERTPLTVRQLLKLSEIFAYPFTTERRVQERLQQLCAAGRVRRWIYATAGQGALSYYTLSPLGYQLLRGPDAFSIAKGAFGPVGVARQSHTRHLAEVIVHLLVAAHASDVEVATFQRENAVRLQIDDLNVYPDCAFALRLPDGTMFSYFVELDNSTETVRSTVSPDAWERKIRCYEAYQDSRAERFRVLLVTTGGRGRLENLLRCAADGARNPRRSLVYGTQLADFLQSDASLTRAVFRNHHGQPVSLLPGKLVSTTVIDGERSAKLVCVEPAC